MYNETNTPSHLNDVQDKVASTIMGEAFPRYLELY